MDFDSFYFRFNIIIITPLSARQTLYWAAGAAGAARPRPAPRCTHEIRGEKGNMSLTLTAARQQGSSEKSDANAIDPHSKHVDILLEKAS